MSIKTGITSGTPAKIAFGAGVFFQGVTYDEKVAPTEEAIKAAIIGATQEGGKLTITPEFFAPDLDGALVAVKELQQKVGETATLETSMVELSAEYMAHSVIGEINDSTDKNYDVVTSSELRSGHFYEGFGYYGELLDGRPFICLFKNALCTSGFATESKNKENTKFTGTFECQSDITYGVEKLPYALFLRKAKGWTAVQTADIDKRAE
jgi:hypothetical protein